MATLWKTADLFSALLCEPASRRRTVRWHFGDMSEVPVSREMPATAWYVHPWGANGSWHGCSVAEACDMARDGWQDGARQAHELREDISGEAPRKARMTRYSVAGAVPSVARYLAGNPMNMRRAEMRETAQRPVITLTCDIAVMGGVQAGTIMCHAAATAAVIDLLEDAGFRCELIAIDRGINAQQNYECAIRLKAPEQPLNLAVAAYGLGHPGFLRRIIFGLYGADPDMKPMTSGLGSCESLRAMPELGAFTIGSTETARGTAAQRFQAICEALRGQGCPGIPDLESEERAA